MAGEFTSEPLDGKQFPPSEIPLPFMTLVSPSCQYSCMCALLFSEACPNVQSFYVTKVELLIYFSILVICG
jgi:hypothetical protein